MTTITALFEKFDRLVVWTMDAFGIKFARLALGIVFIWFGALKMIGDLSPAYDLVAATVYWLTPEIIIPSGLAPSAKQSFQESSLPPAEITSATCDDGFDEKIASIPSASPVVKQV